MKLPGLKGTTGQMPQECRNGKFLQGLSHWTNGGSEWSWDASAKTAVHEADTGHTGALEQTLRNVTHTTITYSVVFTVTGRTAGTVTCKIGSGDTGTARSTNATFTEEEVFTTDAKLQFVPDADFDGAITQVSVLELKTQP